MRGYRREPAQQRRAMRTWRAAVCAGTLCLAAAAGARDSTTDETLRAAPPLVQRAMGTGKLVLVEKVTKGEATFYEGHIASGGQTTEVKLDASGQPVE